MRLNTILELLWPARCSACHRLVPSGRPFCSVCEEALIPISLQAVGTDWPATAMTQPDGVEAGRLLTFSSFAYGGAITQAILRLKHGKNRSLARPLGIFLHEPLQHFVSVSVQPPSHVPLLACPVPLHPQRLRERGFNQSLELLRAACVALAPMEQPRIVSDLLRRNRHTPSLGHASRLERQRCLKGAFSIKMGQSVANRQVLIVDDVMTTGATALECAQVLWKAGAKKVMILTLARAMPSFLP